MWMVVYFLYACLQRNRRIDVHSRLGFFYFNSILGRSQELCKALLEKKIKNKQKKLFQQEAHLSNKLFSIGRKQRKGDRRDTKAEGYVRKAG